MNDKEIYLQKLRSTGFAMWELHIFLDTHPTDSEALMMFDKYSKKRDVLLKDYEAKYGPLDMRSVTQSNRFEWINSPWPWEYDEEDD